MSRLCCGDIHNLTDIFSTSCELADRVSYKVDSRLFLEMQRLKGKMPLPARASSFFVGCCQAKRPRDPIHGWAQPGAFTVIFFFVSRPRTAAPEQRQFLFPLPERTRSTPCFLLFVRSSVDRGGRAKANSERKFSSEYCAAPAPARKTTKMENTTRSETAIWFR
jgi:hypothetical protein